MDSFSVPVLLYILFALGIAAAVGLGALLLILGQTAQYLYKRLTAA